MVRADPFHGVLRNVASQIHGLHKDAVEAVAVEPLRRNRVYGSGPSGIVIRTHAELPRGEGVGLVVCHHRDPALGGCKTGDVDLLDFHVLGLLQVGPAQLPRTGVEHVGGSESVHREGYDGFGHIARLVGGRCRERVDVVGVRGPFEIPECHGEPAFGFPYEAPGHGGAGQRSSVRPFDGVVEPLFAEVRVRALDARRDGSRIGGAIGHTVDGDMRRRQVNDEFRHRHRLRFVPGQVDGGNLHRVMPLAGECHGVGPRCVVTFTVGTHPSAAGRHRLFIAVAVRGGDADHGFGFGQVAFDLGDGGGARGIVVHAIGHIGIVEGDAELRRRGIDDEPIMMRRRFRLRCRFVEFGVDGPDTVLLRCECRAVGSSIIARCERG